MSTIRQNGLALNSNQSTTFSFCFSIVCDKKATITLQTKFSTQRLCTKHARGDIYGKKKCHELCHEISVCKDYVANKKEKKNPHYWEVDSTSKAGEQ